MPYYISIIFILLFLIIKDPGLSDKSRNFIKFYGEIIKSKDESTSPAIVIDVMFEIYAFAK